MREGGGAVSAVVVVVVVVGARGCGVCFSWTTRGVVVVVVFLFVVGVKTQQEALQRPIVGFVLFDVFGLHGRKKVPTRDDQTDGVAQPEQVQGVARSSDFVTHDLVAQAHG